MPKQEPPVNPHGLVNQEAEQRAEARREQEKADKKKAEAAAKQQEADEKAAAEKEAKAKAEFLPIVTKERAKLQKDAEEALKVAAKLEEKAKAIRVAAGDLSGAVISAGDVVRQDPHRAMHTLRRGKEAFEKAIGHLVNPKS